VVAQDQETGRVLEVEGQAVVSATGAWTDEMRARLGWPPRLRLLRGGHLIFPRQRLPLTQAMTLFHPQDRRFLYVMPWEGAVLLGTTDLEHRYSLQDEPRIDLAEGTYLLEAARRWFPSFDLGQSDIISTFCGVRPVVNTGRKDPDKESRDHVVWSDKGLVTVTGGKLTTFVFLAQDALKAARKYITWADPGRQAAGQAAGGLAAQPVRAGVEPRLRRRMTGRYGADGLKILEQSPKESLETVGNTGFLWAELSWAARTEQVVHLEDLLLRRTRLGLLLPDGGSSLLERVREAAQPGLGWDDQRWQEEAARYLSLWAEAYSPRLIG